MSPEVAQERGIEQKLLVQTRFERIARLNAVAYPMWTRGSDLCGARTTYSLWASFSTQASMQALPDLAQAVQSVVPLARQPTIVIVTRGGPAEQAGLMRGDVITALEGQPVAEGVAGEKQFRADFRAHHGEAMHLQIDRGGTPMELVVTPVLTCDFAIHYIENNELNAYADGNSVNIFSGMIRFAESDQQLALVMGHELAHDSEGHAQLRKQDARSGQRLDVLAGLAGVNTHGKFTRRAMLRYSQQYESEADYVGLYFMALGGYSVDGAAEFWRRIAVEDPSTIKDSYQSLHPSSPARFTALEKTAQEIDMKIAAGQPLQPDPARRTRLLQPGAVQTAGTGPAQPAAVPPAATAPAVTAPAASPPAESDAEKE